MLTDTVIELVDDPSDTGETEDSAVSVDISVLSVSRLSCVPGAVGATVLNKDEDVPVTTEVEVNISGVRSPEPSSSVVEKTELFSGVTESSST